MSRTIDIPVRSVVGRGILSGSNLEPHDVTRITSDGEGNVSMYLKAKIKTISCDVKFCLEDVVNDEH